MSSTPLPPEALDEWLTALADRLQLDPADVPVGDLLEPLLQLSVESAGSRSVRAGRNESSRY